MTVKDNYKRWTPSAKECYYRGCVCSGCKVFDIIGKRCQMKGTVIELVRQLGIPDERTHNIQSN